jgi:hypothetical protein
METGPQGVIHHLLEGLAAVERLLAELAEQSIIDRECGAQGIKMLPPRHHGIVFGASA